MSPKIGKWMARQLRTVRAFITRDLAIAASYRFNVVLQAIAACLLIALLYFVAKLVRGEGSLGDFGGYFPFAVVGLASLSVLDAAYANVAAGLRAEQAVGTLEELLLSPTGPASLLLGGAAFGFARACVTALIYFAAATVIHGGFLHGNLPLALAILALGAADSLCLGVLSASFAVVFKRGDPLQFVLRGAALLLGGVLFPLSTLPSGLQAVSRLLPVTWTLEAVRRVALQGASARDVAGALLFLGTFLVVALPLSLYCLRRAVARAMRDGSLSQS